MTTSLKKTTTRNSLGKIILFTIACVFIFILIAIVCDLLTFWITPTVLKVVVREVLLRMPLTILSLHLFAVRVIKSYNPTAMYGKLVFLKALKWIGISFILSIGAWLLCYLFHLTVLFPHTVMLNSLAKVNLLVKWVAISLAAGLTEEVLFRGHLFMILRSRYSAPKAILITSLIFGLVHIFMLTSFKPIDIVIVIVGGIISGIMFSAICTYTRAIWYVAIVHFIWDIFFIGKITTVVSTQAEANQAVMAFKLNTQNLLLTGGNFGMEASVPGLMLYVLVTAILYYLYRERRDYSLN